MWTLEYTHGDPAAPLRFGERPRPVCGPDQVLIQIRAAGMNHADISQRAGRYPLKPEFGELLGLEVAGTVVEAGRQVPDFNAGDEVCALLAGGGYAEFVAVPAAQCLPMPKGLSFVQAAALPEALATVWLNVFQKARLRAGEKLLVHGGSSGVGMAAIQLATALGAQVFTTAGSDAKCAACLEEGAALAINYKAGDFEQALAGQRVDVVLDMVGGEYFARNMRLLAHDGRMVYIASVAGKDVALDLVLMMRRRIALFGSVLRPLDSASKGRILRDMAATAWPLLESGRIRTRIHQVFAFSQAEEAHALMRSHQHVGKLVLEVR